MKTHKAIPKNFPVQPLKPGQDAKEKATCGYCLLSWDDAIPTTWTPAPAGRCPFEYFHIQKEPIEKTVIALTAKEFYQLWKLIDESTKDEKNYKLGAHFLCLLSDAKRKASGI